MSSLNRLSDQQKALAKAKFMSYESPGKIAQEMGISRTALYHYIKKEWRAERELLENEVISEFADKRVSILSKISKHSAEIILKSLESLSKREKPPTVIEARAAVTIFESLDKIMRLDKGTPTDIIGETKPMTIIELKQEFAQIDPFYKEPENDEIITIDYDNTSPIESDDSGAA